MREKIQNTPLILDDLDWRIQYSLSMHTEMRSSLVLDAPQKLSAEICVAIRTQYDRDGYIHIKNTGLKDIDDILPFLAMLGFSKDREFRLGGRTSSSWQEKWVAPGLRRMDYYPPHLYLLPNNEVQYQRCSPRDVLFFCVVPPQQGGRTFLHSAKRIEDYIAQHGGGDFLSSLHEHGLRITTGFVHKDHPIKSQNYFASWQERFHTDDPKQALRTAQSQTEEYDTCWWKENEEGYPTLMTSITLSAFATLDNTSYLRFPRISLGEPSLQNGFRSYTLGNGLALSQEEKELLFVAYHHSKEGIAWEQGDMILFDNIRYGHSREAFSGERSVFVGMAGTVWDAQCNKQIPKSPTVGIRSFASSNPSFYYQQPLPGVHNSTKTMRIFDAQNSLCDHHLEAIQIEFTEHGALHIINTGLKHNHPGELSIALQRSLGFEPEEQFLWGGSNSGRTQRKHLGNGLYTTDYYPKELFLLPHNEILYQQRMPTKLLLFSTSAAATGGRTFVHCAKEFERFLLLSGTCGQGIVEKMHQFGFRIDTGFLDMHHPSKELNYFRSWQERFHTDDPTEAYQRCSQAQDQFNECWWYQDFPHGEQFPMLMTRVQVPAVLFDHRYQSSFLLFPRIALDKPSLPNGFREFSFGDGSTLTPKEMDTLLSAYVHTAQGRYMKSNDILLVDNIRYGHSREPFSGKREVGIIMAGLIENKREK